MQKEFTKEVKYRQRPMDFVLLIVTIALLCIGLLVLSSASSYFGLMQQGNSYYFLLKQLFFAALGIFIMLTFSKLNYMVYKRFAYLGYVGSLILMSLVLIPAIGGARKGASRWLDLGFTTVQPSEIMKVALIIAIATYIASNMKRLKGIKLCIVPILMFIPVGIIMYAQNHLSGTVIIFLVAATVVFVSGVKINPIIIFGTILIVCLGGFFFVTAEEFRMKRITTFLHPETDIKGDSWQVSQSLYAIGSGGIIGKGIGQSRQKYLWLPEAQNDFIFSVLGEELGLVGALTVIGLFGVFIWRGIMIAIRANDIYALMLASRNNSNVCTSDNYKHSGCNFKYASNWYATTIF